MSNWRNGSRYIFAIISNITVFNFIDVNIDCSKSNFIYGYISETEMWTLPLDEPEDICIDEIHDLEDPIEATTIDECAAKCGGITDLFAYGTNDFGGHGCEDGLCKCHCIRLKDSNDETCQQLKQKNYWLLTFKPGVNFDLDGKLNQSHFILLILCLKLLD